MPLKLGVGLTRKVGEPHFGSIGASCHLELELDGLLLERDPAAFQGQVRDAYAACAQAVADELEQQRTASHGHQACRRSAHGRDPEGRTTPATGSGTYSNGSEGPQPATERQIAYIRRLAGDVVLPAGDVLADGDALPDTDRVDGLALRLYGRPLEELFSQEASQLIDRLRAARGGILLLDPAEPTAGAGS